ncbi:MAG: corrinoid protein [Desulfurococcus sp.]|nr:corrinoid protein [Desulfurococcus sp.]
MNAERNKLLQQVRDCLVNLNEDCVLRAVSGLLERGVPATEIVLGSMSSAMEEIGRLYEEGEYFIAELVEAADIFKKAMKILEPRIKEEASKLGSSRRLRIVIGTVKGDVHDIGKTLVAVMLQAAGHEVIDLGVDVDAEKFAEAVEKYNPQVLGMSALLTTTARYMAEVLRVLEERGLRRKVYVVIGGAATSREFAERIKADGWARDAIEAVKLINKLAEEMKDHAGEEG